MKLLVGGEDQPARLAVLIQIKSAADRAVPDVGGRVVADHALDHLRGRGDATASLPS
jgi:hypothetical protein